MLALSNLTKYENGKTTKILKRWFNVFNDYLVILLLTVPIFVGGMEVVSGSYACVPVVDCSIPYGKFTHDFTYENFICEIVMWNWNNSHMKISYVKSISHMKVSHMKFSYVKSLCGIGTIHI